jgi:glycosyltransferase involved in cell wall biosynthesis
LTGRPRKRIALVTEAFHPSIGGQEVRFLELGEMFTRAGWRVDVFTIACASGLPKFEIIRGLRVHRLVEDTLYIRRGKRLPRRIATIVKFSVLVARRLARERFDVALFNQWPVLPQILVGRPDDTLTVLDWCEHRSGFVWQAINTLLAGAPHKHICVSDELGRILKTRYGASPVLAIPSGIERDLYGRAARKEGLLFFGRLVSHKHPELAIEATAKAREAGLRERLTIAGGGPLLEQLKARYGNLDWLDIRGPVPDDEKRRLLAASRLLLLPSEREGFPRVVAEAMASGTPIVTTRCPDNGTVKVVEQYGCGVIADLNAESLAAAATDVLGSDEKWAALSTAGIRNSLELEWQTLFSKLEAFLLCEN